ncbi:MAG: hypothetical protein HOV80_29340 [Polyangiaceae bacterium]|nr:hypothetical protein [Polyangiaceae bacterium]
MRSRSRPAVFLLFAFVGCDGDIGSGGGGDQGGSTAQVRPSPTGGPTESCDAIAVCEGDTANPDTGCIECAVLGNATLAIDGGACLDEYTGCFGPGGSCDEGGHPGCCAFFDCLVACPADDPGTPADEYLDCACDNDGTECYAEQEKGTCLGDEPTGGQRYLAWASCLLIDVCTASCSEEG